MGRQRPRHNAPDHGLSRFVQDQVRHGRIIEVQGEAAATKPLHALDAGQAVDDGHDHVVGLDLQGSVDHDEIAIVDPGADHG